MKILVCISSVPDTTTKINFTPDNKSLLTQGVQFIINPYDEIALTRALELTEKEGGKVTVITVGDHSTEPVIRKALAVGANDAIRVDAVPRDAFFTASQIAKAATENNYDLILCGHESIDYNGARIPSMVAEMLRIPSVTICKKLTIEGKVLTAEREIEGGKEVVECPLPAVVSASEGMAAPRIPNMRGIMSARTKPLAVTQAVDVPKLSEVIGYDKPQPRSTVQLIPADQPEKLIELLHTQARVI
ncbi:MAG: electron transfer flavoprotein subunit beta/FixA family protein [Bacteroidia bacterium]|nr:electron transfer flavoprotein subunit beta/FixA family protein [Bacteroidia bacterium]MCZ2277155.1 electron transfer flavoprotein subunit beta/FixA family protein [Bacteroidia bacterium]